jgi:hypothetical protein
VEFPTGTVSERTATAISASAYLPLLRIPILAIPQVLCRDLGRTIFSSLDFVSCATSPAEMAVPARFYRFKETLRRHRKV